MEYKNMHWFLFLTCCLCISSISSYCAQEDHTLSYDRGFLESPYYYAHNYPYAICKTWILHGRPGMKVVIKFVFLDIYSQNTSNCDSNYISIVHTSEYRFCGNSTTQSGMPFEAELSDLNSDVYIVLNSSSSSFRGSGFKLSYESSFLRPTTSAAPTSMFNVGCAYQRLSDSGIIEVTPIVRFYLRNSFSSCYWTVLSPNQSVTYKLFFQTCSLSSGDVLKIYDGTGQMANLMGSYNSMDCPNVLITTKNSFYIEFISLDKKNIGSLTIKFDAKADMNSSTQRNLEAVYQLLLSVCVRNQYLGQLTVTSPFMFSTTTIPPSYWQQFDYCHFNISSLRGEVSINDVVYVALKRCGYFYWQLHNFNPPDQYSIYELSFERFDVLPGDVVYFYDGPNGSSRSLGAFMKGLSTPYHLTSSGNYLLIRYIPTSVTDGTRANITLKFSVIRNCPLGYLNCMFGESDCYPSSKRCDGFWDCPIHGGDEKGCPNKCEPGEFSCNSSSRFCYKESERCNGRGSCANYADEMGCTPEQCSPDKGLFLCNNGRCIYEKWRCDRTSDCRDNSDEIDCSPLSSPRVIVAAVVGSLVCVLLLVISLGCVCKLYNMRMNSMRRGTRHETPLSRQLAEMFHRRAPPPPYHEAMLTSRPYDEAYMELLAQVDENGGQFNGGMVDDESDAPFVVPRERSQRERRSRRCRHNRRHRDVNQSGTSSHDTDGLDNTDALSTGLDLFPEIDGNSTCFASLSRPPAYSETVSSLLHGQDNLDSSGESDDDVSILDPWQTEDDSSQASMFRDSQIETTPASHTASHEGTLNSVLISFQHSVGTLVEIQGDSDKDNDTTSTNLSVDSTAGTVPPLDGGKVECEGHMTMDDDSDTECILAVDDETANMNDDLASDTVCLLSHDV